MTACCRPPRRLGAILLLTLGLPILPGLLTRASGGILGILLRPRFRGLHLQSRIPLRALRRQLIHRPQTRSRPLVYAASVQPRHLTPNIGRLPPFSRFREFSAIGKASHYESAATPQADRPPMACRAVAQAPATPSTGPLSYARPHPYGATRVLTALAFAVRPDRSGTVVTCRRSLTTAGLRQKEDAYWQSPPPAVSIRRWPCRDGRANRAIPRTSCSGRRHVSA